MKITRLSIFLAVVLVISVGLTAVALAASTLDQIEGSMAPSELEINAEIALPKDGHISAQTFCDIKTETKDMLSTADVVKIKKTDIVERYLAYTSYELSELITTDGEFLSVRTKTAQSRGTKTEAQLQYLTILSVLTSEYADYVTLVDAEYDLSFNRNFIPILFVCTDYVDAGYDTIADYYKDIKAGVCDAPESAFYVYFSTELIRAVNDKTYTNLFE